MQKCETVEQLVSAYGAPSHKAHGQPEIWHYPLGILNGMLYSIHAAIDSQRVAQVYIHMVPAEDTAPARPFIGRLLEGLTLAFGQRRASDTPPAHPVGWSSMAALLEDLEALGEDHVELYDTDVRERMWAVVDRVLLKQGGNRTVPDDLGMLTAEGNRKLKTVLEENLERVAATFAVFKLNTEHDRRRSFLNPNLKSESGRRVEDFFGHP
jgi:hypothetical protein